MCFSIPTLAMVGLLISLFKDHICMMHILSFGPYAFFVNLDISSQINWSSQENSRAKNVFCKLHAHFKQFKSVSAVIPHVPAQQLSFFEFLIWELYYVQG